MAERFRSLAFNSMSHDVEAFDSGEPALDEWICHRAATEDRRGHSRTYVWVEATRRVVGYYTLSAHRVTRDALPNKLGRGGPREVPAVLIGKLALDRKLRGAGIGVVLLADALDRCVGAAAIAGAKFAVVDAIHSGVAAWYERLGFVGIPGSLVLVRSIRDIGRDRDQ